jgi:hypothetical protein
MESFKNIELIEGHLSNLDFRMAGIEKDGGYQLKKIYIKDKESLTHTWVQHLFPKAEVVQDTKAITEDNGIELIIISAPQANDLDLLAQIVGTGKHVRIV